MVTELRPFCVPVALYVAVVTVVRWALQPQNETNDKDNTANNKYTCNFLIFSFIHLFIIPSFSGAAAAQSIIHLFIIPSFSGAAAAQSIIYSYFFYYLHPYFLLASYLAEPEGGQVFLVRLAH